MDLVWHGLAQSGTSRHILAARKILKIAEVALVTGLSRRSIYRFVKQGEFPAPLRLGPGRVGWTEEAIDVWIERCAAETRERIALEAGLIEAGCKFSGVGRNVMVSKPAPQAQPELAEQDNGVIALWRRLKRA